MRDSFSPDVSMAKISELLERLPPVKTVHMSANGIALWICWEGDIDPSVGQTLQDYGGMHIGTDRNQSLWFFFNIDVMLALARLAVWAKYNPMAMAVQVFPSRLLLSVTREQTIATDITLNSQEIVPPRSMQVWIHPKIREQAANIPGLSFIKAPRLQGMASVEWVLLEADIRLPYTSAQGWYALVHPLGNQLDKAFQAGWRFMFNKIDAVIQQHKFKYNVHETFVMLSLDNLRALRLWVRELLTAMGETKTQHPESYWPCVCVIVDRRGLNLNNELPKKVGIKWDQLVPDFPYVSYRNAYLMGEGFTLNELHFSSSNATMDSWCTVGLGENQAFEEHVPVLVAGQLVAGDGQNCFYCGARNHEPGMCPTRRLKTEEENIWKEFGDIALDTLNESFRNIDAGLTDHGLAGYERILESGTPASLLLKACFEINHPAQLREAERMWSINPARSREELFGMKAGEEDGEPPKNLLTRESRDESPLWPLFDRFCKLAPGDLGKFEKDVQAAITRIPRDGRLRTLLGFVLMERGEATRALAAWREGETLSSTSPQQAWHQYLQGRLLEVTGRHVDAQEMYQTALRLSPQWREVEYRLIVCRVKMGFTEQVQQRIVQLVHQDASSFNRFLIDPELERGHFIILTALFPVWNEALHQATEERAELERLEGEVNAWFPEEHPVAFRFRRRIAALAQLSGVTNYMAFLQVIKNRPGIEKDILQQIHREIEQLQETYKNYLSILEIVRDEASWFPFPRVLVEFNRDFNECAGIINWAFGTNFHETDAFKRAQAYIPTVSDLLKQLERRLRFLRVVRDATLFVIVLVKTFFWVEVVGIVLCLIVVPAIAIYGDQFGLAWLKGLIRTHHWELQKVLITIVSIMALGVAVLRTTLVFERKRERLLADARIHREQMQQKRLERIRESKRAQVEREAKFARSRAMFDTPDE